MAVVVERKNIVLQGTTSSADMRFLPNRQGGFIGALEGDVFYDAQSERLRMEFGDSIPRTIVGRRVTMNEFFLATISGGVMNTAGGTYISLAAASGTADQLDTLDPVVAAHLKLGDLAVLRADAGDTITVAHNTGNLHLNGDSNQVLVNNNHLILIWSGVTDWYQLTPMTVIA